MADEAQTALWKEEVTAPPPELADLLYERAEKKRALSEFANSDKDAKDAVKALAKSMELPGGDGQLIIHAVGTRWACDLKSHTRVSIKELPDED